MNEVLVDGRPYPVPGRWPELSSDQYVGIVALLHAYLPRLELKLRLTLVLLDAARRPRLYRKLLLMSDQQRHDLTALADFCLQEPRFTKQLQPVLNLGTLYPRLHGPADALADLTFAEFIEAEGHFAAYHADRDRKHLALLVASLYRTRPKHALVPTGALLLARLPRPQLLAVRFWYASCRASWARKYAGTIFTQPTEAATEARPANPRDTWREILAERAGSPLHYEAYGQVLLPNIFFDLDQRIRRRREENAALEAGRRS